MNLSRPPVIGISCYVETAHWGAWHRSAGLIPETYLRAVRRAGAVSVLLPPTSPSDEFSRAALSAVDGLLLAGGADIDPGHYGAEAHPRTANTRPERDDWEFALLRRALQQDLPVLAVCRGMQLLNVAHGGTLHQHLPDHVGHTDHQVEPGRFNAMDVSLESTALPGRVLGTTTKAHCAHHQAVARIGAGLQACGWAADGTVEALWHPERSFVAGVQWHPEETADCDALFAEFVAHAAR